MDGLSKQEILVWLRERKENCFRIAEKKTGSDRTGWLQDARYFGDAIKLIEKR